MVNDHHLCLDFCAVIDGMQNLSMPSLPRALSLPVLSSSLVCRAVAWPSALESICQRRPKTHVDESDRKTGYNKRYDAEGAYIRHWLLELAVLPTTALQVNITITEKEKGRDLERS